MINSLIERYKTFRKQNFLNQFQSYNTKYAFVGVGNHSISNLYPCIDYLGLPLKYICTRNLKNAELMAAKFQDTKGIDSLEIIKNDSTIKGVFVCASPSAHFNICKELLQAGKHIFVEKPPCLTTSELKELITLGKDKVTVVGVQKRYSTLFSLLKKKIEKPISYNYRFVIGAYPEGDAIWDLFIHPLDVLTFLFGKSINVQKIKNQNTLFLQIQHENNVIGTVELSTDYTWNLAKEEIIINTENGIFESKSLNDLQFIEKSKIVMGIPLEKVLKRSPKIEILLQNNGTIPIAENNQLFTHGYLGEIKTFISLVEEKKEKNKSNLKDILPTFELIEKIKG